MNRKLNKNYNSHKGSTLMLVLIAVSFISLLGAVTLFVAFSNLILKKYDAKNKETFYTAESVLDEVYTGLGMKSMDNMSGAYSYVLAHIMTNESGGVILSTPVSITEEEANTLFRKKFILNIIEDLGGKDISGYPYLKMTDIDDPLNLDKKIVFSMDDTDGNGQTVCKNAMAALNKTIKSDKNAKVDNISAIEVYFNPAGVDGTGYKIVIKDANINYKKNAQELFSELTVDFVIQYPPMNVIFTSEKKDRLQSFKDYTLISQTEVAIRCGNTGTQINGGVFGAGDILVNDSTVTFTNGVCLTGGDITVKNNSSQSVVGFNNSKLWAQNLVVETDVRKKPTSGVNNVLNVDANSSIYLTDDLQLNANYSQVSIGGNYWGYGTGYRGFFDTHLMSSSIILNGKYSTLNLNNVKNLLLSGKAYLVYNSNQIIPTAESFALKGNQRYYMIPDKYLKATWVDNATGITVSSNNVSQPMNPANYPSLKYSIKTPADATAEDDPTSAEFNFATTFFGAKYLADEPFVQKSYGGNAFAYMTFKSNAAANKYLECLLNTATFNSEFPGASLDIRNSYEAMVLETKSFLSAVDSVAGISIAGGASVYSTGLLLQYDNSNVLTNGTVSQGGVNTDASTLESRLDSTVESTENPLFAATMQDNFYNRYNILMHLLHSIDEYDSEGKFKYQTTNTPSMLTDESGSKFYEIPEDSYTKTVFDNIIDTNAVISSPIDSGTIASDGKLVYIGSSANYTIPSNAKYGVVVSTGSVVVESSFKGLIIAKGLISVTGSGLYTNDISEYVTTGSRDIIEFIAQEGLEAYFIPCQGAFNFGEETPEGEIANKISKVSYTDIVSYTNWRKTEAE